MTKTLKGKIIKGIGGFYYVDTKEGVIECRARGKFRHEGITPLVGDNVSVKEAYVIDISERKNELIRPRVANADRAAIIFAAKEPKINFEALDKFIILARAACVEPFICINKIDLDEKGVFEKINVIYANCGCSILSISAISGIGVESIKNELKGVTTVFAGPSGTGKSSVINLVVPNAQLKIGEVSKKIARGKHTTREAVLLSTGEGGYVIDTPGFTSLSLSHIKVQELANYFYEFDAFKGQCKFTSCSHTNETVDCCAVKAAAGSKIHIKRYERYVRLYKELDSLK